MEGDLFEQTLADGDILLLCSDGLTGMVEDGKIAEVLAGAGTLEDRPGAADPRARGRWPR